MTQLHWANIVSGSRRTHTGFLCLLFVFLSGLFTGSFFLVPAGEWLKTLFFFSISAIVLELDLFYVLFPLQIKAELPAKCSMPSMNYPLCNFRKIVFCGQLQQSQFIVMSFVITKCSFLVFTECTFQSLYVRNLCIFPHSAQAFVFRSV